MFLKQQPQKSKAWPCIHIAGSTYPDIFTAKVNLNTCFYVTGFFKQKLWVIKNFDVILIFFFCSLKLSMMTPMKRLRVKKEPKMMKNTK
jgi:hypothetical protein